MPLVVLDEPFTGIDAPSRARIVESLVTSVEDNGPTIPISTHELHEAETLFDQAVFLADGRVVLAGSADELRQRHGSMGKMMESPVT